MPSRTWVKERTCQRNKSRGLNSDSSLENGRHAARNGTAEKSGGTERGGMV